MHRSQYLAMELFLSKLKGKQRDQEGRGDGVLDLLLVLVEYQYWVSVYRGEDRELVNVFIKYQSHH